MQDRGKQASTHNVAAGMANEKLTIEQALNIYERSVREHAYLESLLAVSREPNLSGAIAARIKEAGEHAQACRAEVLCATERAEHAARSDYESLAAQYRRVTGLRPGETIWEDEQEDAT